MSTELFDSNGLRREKIVASRTLSNIVWACVVCLGGSGFILVGLSSYWKQPILPFFPQTSLLFLPQGLVMGFYGIAGVFLGLYLWLAILWDVGGGWNEFDTEKGVAHIFRWGFPGQNRRIHLFCRLEEAECLLVRAQQGVLSSFLLLLKVRGKPAVPLGGVAGLSPREMEDRAAELARFLNLPVEADT
uniref:Photosystem I assembly protein Ycf4 n=1 Tax=Streptosarcina moshanensis TaxID=3096259 RepID=A0AAU0UG24_9VIRI|nr:hypothetical chloroplast RF4 [Streptosarcina arenaria]YP_010933458.1 hypothetical chloroplast RF4 [Streptosarcina costaricana]WKT08848.1 hypothetical chloroplast RF4 [Streptosarcina arenaria]WKT08949.1 hypothetical chloroplast RF4 [Streptosarcina costaricana]